MSAPVVQLMELTRAAEDAAAADRHTTQSFEIFTNRAIYDNGWTAVSRLGLPWNTASRYGDFEESPWERYNIEEDLCDVLGTATPGEDCQNYYETLHARPARWPASITVLASSNFAVTSILTE